MNHVAREVGKRLAAAALALLVLSGLLFAAVEMLPGDVATHILGPTATPERVADLRDDMGLDDPAAVRYGRWLGGVVHGDLGESATSGRAVTDVVGTPARNSATLAGAAFLAVAVVAVGLGTMAGRRAGGAADTGISTGAVAAMSLPEFVVAGLLVAVVALGLGWFPAVSLVPTGGSPFDRPEILVLPVVALTVVGGAWGSRLVRSVVADAAQQPHVEAARLAGLPERTVILRHLLPTAAGPIAQVLAFNVPFLLGGAVAVEKVFGYPGLASLLVEQVAVRDGPVVLAAGLLVALVVVTAFLLADLVTVVFSARGRVA